jgi:hypothetical protein
MIICWKIGNQEHCFSIPVVVLPFGPHRPGPGPVNYPQFIHDATIVASIHGVLDRVSDVGVRDALMGGIKNAVQALKSRGGDYVSKITLE